MGIALLGVDEVCHVSVSRRFKRVCLSLSLLTREFARIADKEDGRVVANHVPVACTLREKKPAITQEHVIPRHIPSSV